MNVLVIDDNPVHLKLAHLVLKAAGNEVKDTRSAEQAFEVIRREPPEVVLLDLKLPGADGLSLVRKLRADPLTRGIRVVAVTAYPDLWCKEEALAAGCDAFLVKPINTRDLARDVTLVAAKAPGRTAKPRRGKR